MPADPLYTDADVELVANAHHRTACRACSDPRECPGVPECVYAEHLDWDGFRAALEALTAPGSPLVARIRAQAGEDAAEAIEDAPPSHCGCGCNCAEVARQATTEERGS
jgi:hypothetical protein